MSSDQYIISGIKIADVFDVELTCLACPEQYSIFLKSTKDHVGYLRLRHGFFYASCPDVGGEVVYEANMDDSDGSFSVADAAIHMPRALLAVYKWCRDNGKI